MPADSARQAKSARSSPSTPAVAKAKAIGGQEKSTDADQKKWKDVVIRIRAHAKENGLSYAKIQNQLFDGLVSQTILKGHFKHPDEFYKANEKTKKLFQEILDRIKHLPCTECIFYDDFESRLTAHSDRAAFKLFEGDYEIFRYGDVGDVAEYEGTMFSCSDCGRPRMRWLAKNDKNRVGPSHRHGHVFLLFNRLYILGTGLDRLILITLQRAEPRSFPLAGMLLTEHKATSVPMACKIVMRKRDATFDELAPSQIANLLANEVSSTDVIMGWKKR